MSKSPKRSDVLAAAKRALPSSSSTTRDAIADMLAGYHLMEKHPVPVAAQAGTATIKRWLEDGTLPIKRANSETITATYVVGDGPDRERVGMNLTKTTRMLRQTGFPTCYAASPTMEDGRRVVVPYHGPVA